MEKEASKINPEIAASYCFLTCYAKGAQSPVTFVHYIHEHPITERVCYERSSDMCTIFLFLEGKFGFLVEDTMYDPSYGDAMIFRNFEKYTSVFYTDSHVDYFQIDLPREFFEAVEVPAFFDPHRGSGHMVTPDRERVGLLTQILRQLEQWILAEEEGLTAFAYGSILQILSLLAGAKEEGKELTAARIPAKLRAAVEYIHSNFTTLSGMEEVAAYCGISGTYLARMFRGFFHCTPNEYLNRLRLSRAKYLLGKGSTLTEACYRSGFNNYTYFISKFRKVTGVTPAKFKAGK